MSVNFDTVKEQIEEIKNISLGLRELVYSAPSQWLWDSLGSTISVEHIAEVIEKIESSVHKVQTYCNEEYKEATDALLVIMWTGLQTKNYEAILSGVKQLNSIRIDFEQEPFKLKLE